jgi:hypothetical protein
MTWQPDYITATDVAAYLRVGDTVDNAEFGIWATASSRAVDKKTNRQFGQLAAPAARVYRTAPWYDSTTGMWLLEIDDLQDVTGFLVNGVAYASSSTVLLPDNAPANGVPWTRLGFIAPPILPGPGVPITYTLTGRWGWTAVPSQVIGACKLQCARWNARRDSPFGIAGSPDTGGELRLLAKLDPDVATTLAGLSRRRRVG